METFYEINWKPNHKNVQKQNTFKRNVHYRSRFYLWPPDGYTHFAFLAKSTLFPWLYYWAWDYIVLQTFSFNQSVRNCAEWCHSRGFLFKIWALWSPLFSLTGACILRSEWIWLFHIPRLTVENKLLLRMFLPFIMLKIVLAWLNIMAEPRFLFKL